MSKHSSLPVRIAIIGAGVRGTSLALKLSSAVYPAVIVAVAEPDEVKRKSFADEFNLPESKTFNGWENLTHDLDECDAAVIATLDNQHAGPALACLNRGWHVLLEKPLADRFEDCLLISERQKAVNKIVAVCHTLRFMEGFRKLKQILDDQAIGQLIHIEHMEGIGNLRFAHNYVRGRWAEESKNTFLLLHKCGHDIDYLNWIIAATCLRVSSFGSLKYFTRVNAPEGSTPRCTDGCRIIESCPYSALRMYVNGPLDQWPAKDICRVHTREAHLEEIKSGRYGICVWDAGNDVVDHQVVMMEFEGGATATCTLSGYSSTNGRRIRLQGSQGEMVYDESAGTISVKRFSEPQSEIISIPSLISYHPEDQNIVDEWISSVVSSTPVTVNAQEALRTHAVVFAAEISRKERRVVEIKEFFERFKIQS